MVRNKDGEEDVLKSQIKETNLLNSNKREDKIQRNDLIQQTFNFFQRMCVVNSCF